MFEDIIQKPKKEKPALPKCCHIYDQEKCQYYILDTKAVVGSPDLCEFFGNLSDSCYLETYNI